MKRTLVILTAILALAGCKGKKKADPVPAPAKAVLVFPAQNSACTTGAILSDKQAAITFTWNSATNAELYDIVIKNLLTNATSTQNVANTQITVSLERGVPYSWYVISKSSQTTAVAQTDPWKFYNAGLGTVSYAPFPAEIVSPTYGQGVSSTGSKVDLTWKGSSVDNNITGYDVYFGDTPSPPLLLPNIKDMFLKNVPIKANTNYYWRVVTADSNGNYSDSGTYQFKSN